MESASTILMIRPANFAYNEQAAGTNFFMDALTKHQQVHPKAVREFDALAETLEKNGVNVIVIDDSPEPHKPDSIFPNNWILTEESGDVYLFPMEAENRRLERRTEIILELKKRFMVKNIIDLSFFEKEGKYLEGTGSMVLDRDHKIAYACLSPRTSVEALQYFCEKAAYRAITFTAVDKLQKLIYHTNVMMCLGDSFAVACLDAIPDQSEREVLIHTLKSTEKEIIEISQTQLEHFAGNMIQLRNKYEENVLVLSEQVYKSLSSQQVYQLQKHCKLVFSALYTIETTGGGSARCMIAEIFLPSGN